MTEGESNGNAQSQENATEVLDNAVGGADAPGAGETLTLMQRPDWVPEKFYKEGVVNFKDMAKSLSELETKLGQQGPASKSLELPPEVKPDAAAAAAAEKQFTIPGVSKASLNGYTSEIQKDGKLSDKSYEALSTLGYNKAMVDAYVRGLTTDQVVADAVSQARIADKQISEITESVGGEEVRNDMIKWAGANLSQEDLDAYNQAVSSSDAARVKQAVFALAKVYNENAEPVLFGGRSGEHSSGLQPFRSNEEVVEAMQNPRYDRDPAYRAEVANRLAGSSVFEQSRNTKAEEKMFTRYQS